jgi:ABC-type transport system substrate-binding protein
MLRARTGSLIAAAAIVFAACGGSATPSPSAAAASAAPSAKATIYANKDVRLAVSEAVNKQSYAAAFYSGLGTVPTGFMPPATIGFKAEALPAFDPTKAKADLAASGVTGSALNIDLYYPSNVVRPYMPDPKGIAQAIASDLQAVGFTVTLKTEDWKGGYITDATNGKLSMYLFGWTCDWAGADNFLYTAWFGYQGGKPNLQFGWKNDAANAAMLKALGEPTLDAANADWGTVQDLLAQDLPMVPIVNSTPPGAYTSKVHGYVGASNGIEYLNSVSLSPAAASPASTATEGGNMVYALDGDMAFADPSLVSDGNSLFVEAQVVQGLLGLQPGTISTVIPVLAASLPTVSADGLSYTFKLRTGIKFHDGTDFNADAVVYNYNRWQNYPKGDLQDSAYYYGAVFGGFGSASNVASVTAPDEQTVVITLKTPQSNFELASTLAVFGIESPTALKAGNADSTPLANNKYAQGQLPQGQDMVGTGPFIFKEWVPGDHVTIVKNPSYWDTPNAAHLDQVTFKPIGDSTAKLQALQSGGVDAAFSISPLDVKTAQGSGLTIIDRGASCNQLNLDMNQSVVGN